MTTKSLPAKVKLNFPPLHQSQSLVRRMTGRYRFIVMVTGRRWGKTRLGSALCIAVGAYGGRAWWVAPSYKTANVGWRLIQKLALNIPFAQKSLSERSIKFPNGGEVQVRSADDPDSLRGEGLDLLVMDECAYIKERAWTESLRPALSDRKGKGVFFSTPKGRNWFWRLYMRGINKEPGWKSYQLPTSNNPYIDPAEIEDARLTLPEVIFEQEYLAVFLESEGAVFKNIVNCLHAPIETSPEEHKDHRIVGGVDWGKHQDFTAISFGCADCGVEVAKDRFNKIDYIYQRIKLKNMITVWKPSKVLCELNAMGEPIFELLVADGLPVEGFTTTASSKPPLVESLALCFENEEFQFQAEPVWNGELEAYERIVSPVTGRSQYSAPEGMNDDTCISRALMWKAVSTPEGVYLL